MARGCKKKMNRFSKQIDVSPGARGFSLIELMVALIVAGIVLSGVFAFGTIQQRSASRHREHIRVQQALEGSMHSMARDIRVAGLGFGRLCSEIRIWDESDGGHLLNPGSVDADDIDSGELIRDGVTGEPYWVLRDGLQVHWRSGVADGVSSLSGSEGTSASTTSAADSFDVILGERNYTGGAGSFVADFSGIDKPSSASDTVLAFESSDALSPVSASEDESWMRQLFVPGSFVLLAHLPDSENPLGFRPESQAQCALVQITGELKADNDRWELPITDHSDFNANLDVLLDGTNNPSDADADGDTGNDWDDDVMTGDVAVIPLGRLRWSRYEIDYSVPSRPYLVRSDIIGFDPESDKKANSPEVPEDNYPGCAGECRLPQLNLPTQDGSNVPRTAIGPMIVDMQVAAGCDGWIDEGDLPLGTPGPDDGFSETGQGAVANRRVDELADEDNRGNDEWVGNSRNEEWAPDCVYHGTAERNVDEWDGVEGALAASRFAPQVVRVTLVGKSEIMPAVSASNVDQAFYSQIAPIEDRPLIDAVVTGRDYQVLTERFTPRNLRWRDSSHR